MGRIIGSLPIMKITLENFRCHADRVFNIPETGLVNLSGNSGDGKSTILSSIVYGFYGKIPGKYKKPYSHGKKSCKVEIEYMGLTITRTKPNRVVVVGEDGSSMEDEAAQSVIESTIGMSYEEFMVGAYIVQRSNASILSMTPLEQTRFIEVLASTNADHVKSVIKAKKGELSEKSLRLQGELDGLLSALEEARGELPKEPPLTPEEITEGFDPDKSRMNIRVFEKKMKDLCKLNEKIQADIAKARKEERRLESTRKKIVELQAKRDVCRESLENTGCYIEGLPPVELLCGEVAKYEERLKYIKKRDSLLKREEDFEKAAKEHASSRRKALKKLEGEVLDLDTLKNMELAYEDAQKLEAAYTAAKILYEESEKSKMEAKKRFSSILKEIGSNLVLSKWGRPPKQISKLIKHLKDVKASIFHFECPSCESKMYLDGNTPKLLDCPTSEVDNDEFKLVERSFIEDHITNLEEIDKILKDGTIDRSKPPSVSSSSLQKEYMKSRRVREEYDSLKDGPVLPPVLERMKKSIMEERKALGDFENVETQEEVEEGLTLARQQLLEIERINVEIEKLNKEDERYDFEIKKLEKGLPSIEGADTGSKEVRSLERQLAKITKESVDLNLKISVERAKLDNVREYEDYQAALAAVKKCKRNISAKQAVQKGVNNLMEGFIGLEAACKEAEILALDETVNSINEHAKVYLDHFFEDPIIVRLECVKEVKSRKALKLQMNTSIEYKGNTYGDIEELSGGERQRCDMAFLLAVSDILGGKMLLLDECLNNLDSSINSDVLGLVRDLCGTDKLVMVISHEAVKGLFDHSIDVATEA